MTLALSSNTVDDAVKIKPIIENFEDAKLIFITSDYHLKRSSLILKADDMSFINVNSDLDDAFYNALVSHEKKAIQSIMEHGLYY